MDIERGSNLVGGQWAGFHKCVGGNSSSSLGHINNGAEVLRMEI